MPYAMHLKTDIFLEQTAVLESFSSTLISCSGSQNSSVSLTGLCLGMRQLTVITPWSPGGTSCSLVFWLSTGCSLFLSLPASQGIYMTPAELKQGIVFFCRATTIFLHPSVLETVIKKSDFGSKHTRSAPSTARRSLFILHRAKMLFHVLCAWSHLLKVKVEAITA